MATSNTNESTKTRIVSRRDLSDEQIADVEYMIESEGLKPSQVCEEMDIPLKVVQNLARDIKYRSSVSSDVATHPNGSPAVSAIQNQINALELAQEKMRLNEQYNLMLQRQRLDLNQIRIDQRRQMLEVETDYPGEDPKEAPITPEAPSPDQELQDYDFENDPIGAGMKFIDRLSQKANNTPNANKGTEPNKSIDATKPLTVEQIDEQIALTPSGSLKAIQMAIGTEHESKIIEGLKKQYPGITTENVDLVLKRIKEKV